MLNISIQAFQSNVVYAIFQNLCNILCNISELWEGGGGQPTRIVFKYPNSVESTLTWQPCIQHELQESDLRVRRDDWQITMEDLILSSLTNTWSCKMCSFTQSALDRKTKSEQRALIQKPFQYPAYYYWLIVALWCTEIEYYLRCHLRCGSICADELRLNSL